MAIHDFTSQRLFVPEPLAAGGLVPLDTAQAHYLHNVLRLSMGAELLVFNGIDGEWRGALIELGKKRALLEVISQTRGQPAASHIDYVFAPLKRARLDYMMQKAVEMGVTRLSPILTQHTVAARFNADRARANAIEAAEQCGVLAIPEIDGPRKFAAWLADWPTDRALIFCDEAAARSAPIAALSELRGRDGLRNGVGVLIGPEGGFAEHERAQLLRNPSAQSISLGPRIMRADTAAVAALTLVNAVLGDWT